MIVHTQIRSYAKKRPASVNVAKRQPRKDFKTLVVEHSEPPRPNTSCRDVNNLVDIK